jgi:uncharacterized protein Yka (UPF0111/DUF47 family)
MQEWQERIEQRLTKVEQQQTEPIKVTRVEIASADVITHLNTLEHKIDTVQEDTNRVTIQMEGARADILRLGESQADVRDRLKEHSEDLRMIKEEQQIHKGLLGEIINVGESHTKRFDQLQESIDSMKSTQEQILKLLQERDK